MIDQSRRIAIQTVPQTASDKAAKTAAMIARTRMRYGCGRGRNRAEIVEARDVAADAG